MQGLGVTTAAWQSPLSHHPLKVCSPLTSDASDGPTHAGDEAVEVKQVCIPPLHILGTCTCKHQQGVKCFIVLLFDACLMPMWSQDRMSSAEAKLLV